MRAMHNATASGPNSISPKHSAGLLEKDHGPMIGPLSCTLDLCRARKEPEDGPLGRRALC